MNNLLVSTGGVVALIAVVVVILFTLILLICSRFKKCPSDKIMVVYGRVSKNSDGTNRSAKCLHGGITFIVPVMQDYSFLDLTPMSISVDLKSALSRQNIRIDVPSIFTVGISTEPTVMVARFAAYSDTGTCQGYNIRSAPSCNRNDGHRGNQYGQR